MLKRIYDDIGKTQVTRAKLEHVPQWLLDKADQKEHDENWAGAYEVVEEKYVPKKANVITSHTVYKVKVDEDKNMKMKSRICPHGNRDREKVNIRKGSSTAQFNVIRLLLTCFNTAIEKRIRRL